VANLTGGTGGTFSGSTLTTGTFVNSSSVKILVNSTSNSTGSIMFNTGGNYLMATDVSTALVDTQVVEVEKEVIPKKVDIGTAFDMEMPDGSTLHVDIHGNYRIDDKDAKVVYQANRLREFNRFVNASDLLVEFIDDLRKLGVPQDKVLAIPIEAFINWLMIRAAEADGEPVAPDVPKLEANTAITQAAKRLRCGCCGRFIPKKHETIGLRFCNGAHADRALARLPT